MRPTGPWGDYGRILVPACPATWRASRGGSGSSARRRFVPPLSLPGIGHVVVTAALRGQLENAKISGMTFRALDKARMVHLDWSGWDSAAKGPAVFPASGEPEDYVLARPHDEAAAAALGEVMGARAAPWAAGPTGVGLGRAASLSVYAPTRDETCCGHFPRREHACRLRYRQVAPCFGRAAGWGRRVSSRWLIVSLA